jgi:hypothetical protein
MAGEKRSGKTWGDVGCEQKNPTAEERPLWGKILLKRRRDQEKPNRNVAEAGERPSLYSQTRHLIGIQSYPDARSRRCLVADQTPDQEGIQSYG